MICSSGFNVSPSWNREKKQISFEYRRFEYQNEREKERERESVVLSRSVYILIRFSSISHEMGRC